MLCVHSGLRSLLVMNDQLVQTLVTKLVLRRHRLIEGVIRLETNVSFYLDLFLGVVLGLTGLTFRTRFILSTNINLWRVSIFGGFICLMMMLIVYCLTANCYWAFWIVFLLFIQIPAFFKGLPDFRRNFLFQFFCLWVNLNNLLPTSVCWIRLLKNFFSNINIVVFKFFPSALTIVINNIFHKFASIINFLTLFS